MHSAKQDKRQDHRGYQSMSGFSVDDRTIRMALRVLVQENEQVKVRLREGTSVQGCERAGIKPAYNC
jgi:hypothetical protein